MTLVITANVALAVIVLTAIVGLLAWSIFASRPDQAAASIKPIRISGWYARRYALRSRHRKRAASL